MMMVEQRNRCRLPGWKKLLSNSIYGFQNQDLHDQLLCQATYYEEFDRFLSGGGDGTGVYSYPYFQPDYSRRGATVITYEETPHCGYAPDFYGQYPRDDSIINGCWIWRATTGFPYVYTQSGGSSGLAYDDFAVSNSVQGDGTINWNRPHVINGHAYLNALEAVNGPSQSITDARTFLGNYTAATNKTDDPQGSFSGTTGLVSWSYSLELDAESGQWITQYQFNAPGFAGYSACSSGPPDYYDGSYFYLGCNDTDTFDYPGYNYGTPTELSEPAYSYSYTYCGPYEYTRRGCREAITLITEFLSDETSRKLISATQSRIYQLNERTGNWRILADGLGGLSDATLSPCDDKAICDCGTRRFRADQLGNYMLFTNNFDPVLSYLFDAVPSGCAERAVEEIEDLTALGVSRAYAIAQWKGFMFLGNVEIGGVAHPDRIMWSHVNSPLEWIPLLTNEAGYQDIGFGQKILAIEPLGDYLFILTDAGLIQATLVSAAEGRFRFRDMQISKAEALRYPNTVVNTGEAILYFAENGINVVTLWDSMPQRIEWIHKASGAVFNGCAADYLLDYPHLLPFGPINQSQCEQAVGGYDDVDKVVWFSWPTDSNQCPNMSLILSMRYGGASLVDHGFTAFANFRSDTRPNLRDFFNEWKVCQFSQWDPVLKEGPPYPNVEVPFVDPPLYLFNPTEDPDLPVHPDSLCARLGDLRIQDICETCDAGALFVMASATDYTLKQYDRTIAYRERFTPDDPCPGGVPFAVASDGAEYCNDGYSSLLQSDMSLWGIDQEKLINGILVDFEADAQTTPNTLVAMIAFAAQARCTTWKNIGSRDLECLTDASAAEHAANNTRPDLGAKYATYYRGRYIAYRIYVGGPGGADLITGGLSCFSKITLSMRQGQQTWKKW